MTTSPPVGGEALLDLAAVIKGAKRHLSKGRAAVAEMMGGHSEVASDGAFVFGHDGRRYLDCGGYGVFILGHCHPVVTAAVTRQVMTHPLATRVFVEPVSVRAAVAVAALVPPPLQYVYFTTSGSEATEVGIKMARSLGRTRLVSAVDGFHGKTMGALSVTGRDLYQRPFEPLLPNRSYVPFGDAAALRAELAREPGTAAVFLEPVQGEGGLRFPPPGYLREVKAACEEFDATLVFDEIFTGMGRMGTMWVSESEGVVPDIMLIGKGLSGGVVPVGAVVATPEAYALLNKDPLMHSATFGAAPIAMAAAEAAAGLMISESVPERAAALGVTVLDDLRSILLDRCGHLVRDIRGQGLAMAVELVDPGLAGDFMLELVDHGIVATHSLNSSAVVRFTPPVCLGEEELAFLREALAGAGEALATVHPAPGRPLPTAVPTTTGV